MARVRRREATTEVIRIAPDWAGAETHAFCAGLEALRRAAPDGAVIHRGRNLIFRHRVGDGDVAVKYFPVRGARGTVYRCRASKAARSFDNATRLMTLGIGTPRPLAAVEVRRARVLLASYYCSEFVPAFREARTLKVADAPDRELLLELLGAFVGRLHESGVLHRDLTAGNILMIPDSNQPGGVSLSVVDVNRMRFGCVGPRAGIANLAQLRLQDSGALLAGYCRARGLSVPRVESRYRVRLRLRAVTQALKERTRPWRRRLGL
jgi:hypothetical protein